MKQTYDFKNVVAETLLIPLYMRAKESRRGDAAILRDSEAERLIKVSGTITAVLTKRH